MSESVREQVHKFVAQYIQRLKQPDDRLKQQNRNLKFFGGFSILALLGISLYSINKIESLKQSLNKDIKKGGENQGFNSDEIKNDIEKLKSDIKEKFEDNQRSNSDEIKNLWNYIKKKQEENESNRYRVVPFIVSAIWKIKGGEDIFQIQQYGKKIIALGKLKDYDLVSTAVHSFINANNLKSKQKTILAYPALLGTIDANRKNELELTLQYQCRKYDAWKDDIFEENMIFKESKSDTKKIVIREGQDFMINCIDTYERKSSH